MSVVRDIRRRIQVALDEVSAAHRISQAIKRGGFVQSSMVHEQRTIMDMLAGQLMQLEALERQEAERLGCYAEPGAATLGDSGYLVERCGIDGRVG